MGHEKSPKAVGALMVTALLAAGCSGSADPAPGPADSPAGDATTSGPVVPDGAVTLTLGNALMDMPDPLIAWAAEVRDETGQTITFEVRSEFGADSAWDDKEQAVLEAVASGELDLGWVGARAVPSFEPMLAPMLVDSHDLQEAVFEAGIPQQMLEDIDLDGVTGLGVLPGPLRRVLGVSRDFRTPQDFAGAVVMGDRNSTTLATLEVLGAAETVPGAEAVGLDGLDGLVAHVGAVVGNSYQDGAESFAANLNLWPRPLVLVASTETLEELTEEHRRALLEAAGATFPEQMEIARDEDALPEDGRQVLCSSPLEVIALSGDELAALHEAVQPVYEQLRQDTGHEGHLRDIEQLKSELDAPPDVFSCEEDAAASPAPTTRQELCAAGTDLPVLEEPAVADGTDGTPTTPLSALALCLTGPDDPAGAGLPDTLVTGERVLLVRFDFSGPPVERCSDTLPDAPSFGLVGLRADDSSARRLVPEGGCRGWHQLSSYLVALAQEVLGAEPDGDTAQRCSPLTLDEVSSRDGVFTGTYSEVTLCVHPWLPWVVEEVPAYRAVQAHALEETELATFGDGLSQVETVGPRPVQECPYTSNLLEVRASRSSDEQDVRLLSCQIGGYSGDGEDEVYWSVFPSETQAIVDRAIRQAANSG